MKKVSEPFDAYLSAHEYLSSSDIVSLLSTTLDFEVRREKNAGAEEELADHFKIGSAMHCLICEPDEYKKRYPVIDESQRPEQDKTMRSNLNKAWALEQSIEAQRNGGAMLTESDRRLIEDMSHGIERNPFAKQLIAGCTEKEMSYYAELRADTLQVKCRVRPDLVSSNYFVSLKTTRSRKPRAFYSSAAGLMYHAKEAFYMLVMNAVNKKMGIPPIDNAYVIVCEKEGSRLCEVFEMNPEEARWNEGFSSYLYTGMQLVRAALQRFEHYRETKKAQSYSETGLIPMFLPNWAEDEAKSIIEIINSEIQTTNG